MSVLKISVSVIEGSNDLVYSPNSFVVVRVKTLCSKTQVVNHLFFLENSLGKDH